LYMKTNRTQMGIKHKYKIVFNGDEKGCISIPLALCSH
jgi:hypothetical protein